MSDYLLLCQSGPECFALGWAACGVPLLLIALLAVALEGIRS